MFKFVVFLCLFGVDDDDVVCCFLIHFPGLTQMVPEDFVCFLPS